MNLSKRLDLLYQYIRKHNFQSVYDVGTDHGQLAIKLALNHDKIKVWATDISAQAVAQLKNKINQQGLKIDCLQADGLTKLKEQTELVVIAGLGTKTIRNILNKDSPLIANYALQVQGNPTSIRNWIKEKGFFLTDETIIKEKKHYYYYLFINKKQGVKVKNASDIIFGPVLLQTKTPTFCDFWKEKIKKMQAIVPKIEDGSKKMTINKQVKLIAGVLKNNNDET